MEVNVKDEKICESGNQVIHVRGNSDSEMQALFDCVLKPSGKTPLQVPFKLRNLPPSFFTPPAHRQSPAPTVSHSREGSADSSYGSGGTPVGPAPPLRVAGTASPTSQTPLHFRHHSSPASLQPSALSIAQPQHVQHTKQHSYDALSEENSLGLPPGWAEARNPQGQIYYLNHKTQSTTWEDPRKKTPSLSSQPPPTLLPPASANTQAQQTSTTTNPPAPRPQQPLPQPSQPSSQPPPLISSQSSHLVTTTPTSTLPPFSHSSAATSSVVDVTGDNNSTSGAEVGLDNPNLGALPPGWQQGRSPEGETYFINHSDRTTSWFDPRIPRHLQTGIGIKTNSPGPAPVSPAQQQPIQLNQLMHSLPPLGPNGLGSNPSVQRQNNYSFHRIHHEKEKLRLRRQEMGRLPADYAQRRALRGESSNQTIPEVQSQSRSQSQVPSPIPSSLSSPLTVSLVPTQASACSASSDVSLSLSATQGNSSALNSTDPFMAATTDFHSRQESADSGLGLGGNYTHPHTPEDFLNTMEDVDIAAVDVEMKQSVASPMLVGGELESMDSEDLVPSIMIEGISPEMLDEMLAPSKLNFQTWL